MDATTPAVVDTDVVSFLFKSHSLAPMYEAILAGRPLAVSLVTLAEIEYRMEAKNWGAGRHRLRRCLVRVHPGMLFAFARSPHSKSVTSRHPDYVGVTYWR